MFSVLMTYNSIQFIYFSPQTSENKVSTHNDKNYIDGEKGHTELAAH
jgi:hypothetical protein